MTTGTARLKTLVVLLFVGLAVASVLLRWAPVGDVAAWQRWASPGALSAPHAFLERDCAACHTPVRGVGPASCVVCHANNEELLALQPTAFHASVRSCSECHLEHQGVGRRPTAMDHAALARIGMRELAGDESDGDTREAREEIVGWTQRHGFESAHAAHPEITVAEMTLDCASCHSNTDPHLAFFGKNCADCHGTAAWAIPAFAHPSLRSTDCAQCHGAPPSHYKMHFEMVDKKVAAREAPDAGGCCEGVEVSQCYRCHQIDAWNNIKGVGWYDHH